jgi:hypothetical protein
MCEIDHSEAWAQSHNSDRTNLADLCDPHHVFKHLPGCELIQLADGVLAWRTPLGLCYVTKPPTYFDTADACGRQCRSRGPVTA